MKTINNQFTSYFLSLFLLFTIPLKAQIEDLPARDSLQNTIAKQAVELIIKSDSISLADSLSKAVLEKQLNELRSSETSKRLSIEKELNEIRKKDSIQHAKMIEDVNVLKSKAKAYPVIMHKDTLLKVYTQIGSISAEERASIITERLQKLYKSFNVKTDSLTLFDNGQTVEIYYGDKIILSATKLDELWFGISEMEIATNYRELILKDIIQYKKDKSLLKKLKEIGLALLVIILQIIVIKGLNYIFRAKINIWLWDKRGIWFKGIKFRNYEFLDQNRQTSVIIFLVKILRFALIAILLYISIPVLFSIFPPTQRIAELLFGYILNPLKSIITSFVNYLPEMITIAVIVTVTRYILKFLKFISKEIEAEKINIPGFFPDWAQPTYNIIKALVLAFMFIVIFPYLPGSDSPIFKGVSVFIGVILSLGSSSIIGNMIAGLVITYMRPFKIGDRIKIGEVTGNVFEKTPFVTRIHTSKKEYITIPNSTIMSSNVINYSNSRLQGGLIVHTTITIGYDVPWRQVHQLMINAAKKTGNLNMEIAPFVLQTSLDDFYVSYQLNAHTNDPDKQPAIYSELHQNIQDGFNEAGLEIMSPHYRANRDGNAMAVPKDHLPEGYCAPGFKIENDSK